MNYAAITLASLASSLHCAAMCGGFAVVVGGLPRAGESVAAARARFVGGQIAWAAGRAVGYMTLGALAGGLGAGLSTMGRAMGWSSLGSAWSLPDLASTLAGTALVVLALHELWPRQGSVLARRATTRGEVGSEARAPVVRLRVPPSTRSGSVGATSREATSREVGHDRPRLAARLARQAADGSSIAAFLLGLSAATLLCGLSWSFVVLASASAGPIEGALVMLAFALGTIPATLSVAGLVRGPLHGLLRWLERRWSPAIVAKLGPKVAATVLLVLGLVTLFGRVSHVPHDANVASDGRVVDANGDDTCHTSELAQ